MAQLKPDHLILPHIPLPDSLRTLATTLQRDPTSFLQVDYTHILWLRDDDHLVISFTVFVPSGPPTGNYSTTPPTYTWPGATVVGALLTTVEGTQVQVMEQPRSGTHPRYVEWNLATSAALSPTASMSASSAFSAQTPALAYQWGADGVLTPEGLLTPTALPPTSPESTIGGPDGDPRFTIWQPGVVAASVPATSSPQHRAAPIHGRWR